MKEIVARLDGQVTSHEEYRKSYIGCLDWMANTRHRLQRLSDLSGDRRTLQDRLQQLKVIHTVTSFVLSIFSGTVLLKMLNDIVVCLVCLVKISQRSVNCKKQAFSGKKPLVNDFALMKSFNKNHIPETQSLMFYFDLIFAVDLALL
jgi:hypothetical protein